MKKLDEIIELAKNEPIPEVPFSDEELLTMLEGPAQSGMDSTSFISKIPKGALIMISGIISLTALLLLTNPQQSPEQPRLPDKEIFDPVAASKLSNQKDTPNNQLQKHQLDENGTRAYSLLDSETKDKSAEFPQAKIDDVAANTPHPSSTGSASASASATTNITVTKTIAGIAALELTEEELKALDIFREGDTYKYPLDILPLKKKDLPPTMNPRLVERQPRFQLFENNSRQPVKIDSTLPPDWKPENAITTLRINVDTTEGAATFNMPDSDANLSEEMKKFTNDLKILGEELRKELKSRKNFSLLPDSILRNSQIHFNVEELKKSLRMADSANPNLGEDMSLDSLDEVIRQALEMINKNIDIKIDSNSLDIMIDHNTFKVLSPELGGSNTIEMRSLIFDETMEEGKAWREWDKLSLRKDGMTRTFPNADRIMIDVENSCAPFMVATSVSDAVQHTDGSFGMKRYTISYLNGNSPDLVGTKDIPMGDVAAFLSKSGIKIVPIRIKLGDRTTTDSSKMLYADADLWYVVDKKFVEKLPERYREPLMKELEIADLVGEGSIAPQEACDRLEGVKSYLDICRAGSANIKDVKAYPQPVSSGALNVEFNLAANETVRAELYSIDGNYIATLAQPTPMKAGKQIMQTNIRGVENGVYLLALKTELGEEVVTKVIVNK
ncbi:MAG: T9SS type A sorting domain-containing protein [Chloroflexota bacterium]